MGWEVLLRVVGGLALLYAVAVIALWQLYRRRRDAELLRSAVRLVPDLARLLRRLAADPDLPRRIRLALVLLALYLVSPIDLIPDFIPVIGYADDALIVALALRYVIRHAGPAALAHHWPGTPEGLAVIQRLAGSGPSPD